MPNYIIGYQAPITYQGAVPNCTAHACAVAKQYLEWKEWGRTDDYSIDWIYGNRRPDCWQGDGYDTSDALLYLRLDGVPFYTSMPGNSYYAEAKQKVEDNYTRLISEANNFKISSRTCSYDINPIKSCIASSNGIAIMDIWDCSDDPNRPLTQVGSDGIVPDYLPYNYYNYHTMAIIGWRTIGAKQYWICQNSWGTYFGDNGIYYVPFNHSSILCMWEIYDAVSSPPGSMPPNTPLYPPSVIIRIEGGVYVNWISVVNATKYRIKLRRGYDGYIQEFNFANVGIGTITGLMYGVTYYISICAGNDAGYSTYSTEDPITTAPQTPSISFGSAANTYIAIKTGAMSGNYDKIRVFMSDDTTNYLECDANSSVTFTGLSSGTAYSFYARSRFFIHSTTIWSANTSNTVSAKTQDPRPAKFYWDNAKIQGQPFNIKATEWNRLIQNIKDVHVYKLGSYSSSQYPMTNVSQGQSVLHNFFNEVRFAIGSLIATGISSKSKGDIIYAHEFDGTNSIVDTLNKN